MKVFTLQKTLLKGWKDKLKTGRKHLQTSYTTTTLQRIQRTLKTQRKKTKYSVRNEHIIKRHFTEDGIQMAKKKHMTRYSTSLAIGETQIRTTMKITTTYQKGENKKLTKTQ